MNLNLASQFYIHEPYIKCQLNIPTYHEICTSFNQLQPIGKFATK